MNTNHTETKYFNPNDLVLHTELLRIYGNTEEKLDLQLDIEANGIMMPLVVSTRTQINTVVSGGRRLRAAIALGINSIPVICYQFPSEQAEKHFILSANRNRPKTKYQQLIEGKEWELLEKQAAAIRRQSGLEQRWKNKDIEKSGIDDDNHDYYPVVLLSDYRSASGDALQSNKKQRTTDRVGSRIGISASTYERGKRVIEKCEKLRHLGKDAEAAALEAYLESAGFVPASDLLRAPNCDSVLSLVGSGKAKTIKEALLKANRIHKLSAVVEGAIFFFPDKMLRKLSYYHSGRVVRIANTIATVCFRDKYDDDLHEHQYKCDELLTLDKEGETRNQIRLRDHIHQLIRSENSTSTDRYVLNRLLGAVVCTREEIDWIEIIEWRIAGKTRTGVAER
jgi:ParB-like nuclease domain